jgi:hypothetical protein
MKKTLAILGTVGLVTAFAGGAFAQEDVSETVNQPVPAPRNAAEIGIGLGYAQPTGNLTAGGRPISDIARAGGEVNAEVGYRVDPRWLVGLYGGYSQFHAPGGTSSDIVNSATGGIQAQYHIMPYTRVDPWVGLGVGYRGFFATPRNGPTHALHGLDVARLRIGADYRVNEQVAMGPVVGMDLTMFTSEHIPGASSTVEAIGSENLTVTPFFFAGLAGKFDIGTETQRSDQMVALQY